MISASEMSTADPSIAAAVAGSSTRPMRVAISSSLVVPTLPSCSSSSIWSLRSPRSISIDNLIASRLVLEPASLRSARSRARCILSVKSLRMYCASASADRGARGLPAPFLRPPILPATRSWNARTCGSGCQSNFSVASSNGAGSCPCVVSHSRALIWYGSRPQSSGPSSPSLRLSLTSCLLATRGSIAIRQRS